MGYALQKVKAQNAKRTQRKIKTDIRGASQKVPRNGEVEGYGIASGRVRSLVGLVQGKEWWRQSLKGCFKTVYKGTCAPCQEFRVYPRGNEAMKNEDQTTGVPRPS